MDGVVYTKSWVVCMMLDLAGYADDNDLVSKVAIEPSCGHGAFLVEMVRRLVSSARKNDKLTVAHLQDSICSFDVDEGAVRHCRDVVAEQLEAGGLSALESKTLAESWIRVGDFLLSDLPKADWVIGNPPYVRGARIDRARRIEYAKRLSCVTLGTDLYVGFIEKGLQSLKSNGVLCYICADRWLQSSYGKRLRKCVARDYVLQTHIRMHDTDAFENDVSAYPGVSIIRRGGKGTCYIECDVQFDARNVDSLVRFLNGSPTAGDAFSYAHVTLPEDGSPVPLASAENIRLVSDCIEKLPSLEECGVAIGIGLATGCDGVYITDDAELVESDRLLPLFYMRDWREGKRQCRFLVNTWDRNGELVDLEKYPRLRAYLRRNESRLKQRRVAKDHPENWYRTLDKLNEKILGKPLLLFPDMSRVSDPVLNADGRYPHHNCYWLTSDSWKLEELGGLLMSKTAEAFVDAFGVKMRGSTMRFQAQYLRKVHLPYHDDVPGYLLDELAAAFRARDRAAADEMARRVYEHALGRL